MKIMITGGCGFLGSNLASAVLRENKADLFLFDNLQRHGSALNLQWLQNQGPLKFFKMDVRREEDVERVVRDIRPDIIFHLAGQVAMTTSLSDPREDFEINAMGTLNVLEAVRNHSPNTAIFYSSTNKVYGDLAWTPCFETEKRYITPDFPNGFPETIQLDFQSPYGCSKGSADQYMLDYHRSFGLKTVVFRHSTIFGSRQFASFDQGWIGWFCKMAIDTKRGILREPFTISGNGKQVRDILFSDDLVELYFSAAQRIDEICGQAFNIGGGSANSLSLLELFEMLESHLSIRLHYKKLPARQCDQKVFVADISKARVKLGWVPKMDKAAGIHAMLEWVGMNG